MRRLIVLAVAAAAAAVVVSGAGAITAPPTNFTDATGDSGSAPDIATVAVTNDDHGLYTFTIGFATPYTGSDNVALLLDTDKNFSTGNANLLGADYLFVDDFGAHSFGVYSWQSNDWAATSDATAAVVVSSDGKSVTFSINKSDLGGSTSLNFFVLSSDGTFDTGHVDDAPNNNRIFTYSAQTVFTLSPGASQDGPAKAGGTWTVSMSAVRSDTRATVGPGARIACKATAGAARLAVTRHAFASGSKAVCTFRVPKADKDKKLRATVTISENGQSATKTFAATAK